MDSEIDPSGNVAHDTGTQEENAHNTSPHQAPPNPSNVNMPPPTQQQHVYVQNSRVGLDGNVENVGEPSNIGPPPGFEQMMMNNVTQGQSSQEAQMLNTGAHT